MHLVTGYAGQEHVTAADMGAFHVALFGSGQFVLGKGNQLAATVISNNLIRIMDGDIYMQGRHVRLNEGTYVDLAIENGTQGQLRNDLIVARYTKNSATAVEEVNLVVIKGTAVASNPSDPAYTSGDLISEHDFQNDMPLYRVPLNGLNVGNLVPLFTTVDKTILDKQDNTNELVAETAISDSDAFPFYDASASASRKVLWSKIKEVLGSVFAAKSHSHSLADLGAAAANHNHAASSIVSGILSVARGGTGVSSLEELVEAMSAARIVTGSYTGTGTCGDDNPTSITCAFPPKVAIVGRTVDQSNSVDMILVTPFGGMTWDGSFKSTSGGTTAPALAGSVSGNTISWYHEADINAQCNRSGEVYNYIVIG